MHDVTGKSVLRIALKLRKFRVFLYLAVLIIWVIVSLHLFMRISDSGIITTLIAIAFLGLFPLAAYPRVLMQQVKQLKETNSYNCINEVLNGHVIPDPATGFAFTDTFLYYKHGGLIIRYDNIYNIYIKRTRSFQNGVHMGTSEELIIDCYLKHKESIFMRGLSKRDENDTSLTPLEALVMTEIISRNPKVKLGYSGEI